MINATSEGKAFDPVPAGTYVARCYQMIHIGTIEQEYMGEKKEMNKIRISWELPTEMKVFKQELGEQPYSVSKEFTLSMHEKANLRKFLESWRGKGFNEEEAKCFDVTKLLGKPCMLSVIHKTSKAGKMYAEISSISTLPKKMECPDQVNDNFEFTYEPFDRKKFESLPDWLKDKIKSSREYREISEPSHRETEPDTSELSGSNDDLPF